MSTVVSRFAVVAGLCVVATGCGSFGLGGGAEGELEENRERWEALALTSYEYAVRRRCFCAPGAIGPARVRVENGVVTGRTYVDSGDPVPDGLDDAFPRVDGLFETLADAYERGAHSVEVTYDPDSGVPLDIYIDYEEFAVDEELGFTVTSLPAPLP